MTTFDKLSRRLNELAASGRPGIGVMKRLLRERSPDQAPLESDLERLFERLMRRSDLPIPLPQHVVRMDGRVVGRPDFAYPDHLIAIELDSYASHMGAIPFQSDRTKVSQLASMGWLVLVFTWHDVKDREAYVLKTMRRALRSRGVSLP